MSSTRAWPAASTNSSFADDGARQQTNEQRIREHEEYEARMRQQHRRQLLEAVVSQLGARFDPSRVSLDNYATAHPGQRQTLARVKALAERLPETVNKGESIILYGTPGTGKDHLMASLLHLATGTHGLRSHWTTGLMLYQEFRRCINSELSEFKLTKTLSGADVLAISDPIPPAADPSAWSLNQLHNVIDQRYSAMRPVWMTLNARTEDEAKDKLTVQLWDRLRDGGHLLPCFWPSHRGDRR